MNVIRRLLPPCLFSVIVVFSGCAMTVNVKPDVPAGQADFILHGKVNYDGNWSYFPRTISNQVTDDDNCNLSFEYAYNVLYGGTTVNQDIVTAFIPTTLIGTPTGASDVQVRAKLDVLDGSKLIKSYVSTCNILAPRGLFIGGNDLTEVRRRGLMAVKENIESQIVQDKEFWASFTNNKKGMSDDRM
jgi:hypothetical protein